MKKAMKISIAVVCVAAVGAAGLYGYNRFFGRPRGPQNTWQAMNLPEGGPGGFASLTEQAARREIRTVITATGTVNLKSEESVYAPANARVKEVLVEVGDDVAQGQPLILYDGESTKSTLEKNIREAEISLENQRLNLQSMTLPATQGELDQLQNSIDSAEKQVYDANATLVGTDAKIAQQLLDIEKAGVNIEKAQADIDDAQGEVDKAQRDVEDAQGKLTDPNGELAKNRLLLEAGGITQSDYDSMEESYRNGVETAENQKKTTENQKKSLEDQRETLRDQQHALENALADLYRTRESNVKNIEAAEKALAYARQRYEDALAVMSTEAEQIQYKQQQNQVALSELNLADLKRQLEELVYETTSPLSGTATKVNVEKGSTVNVDAVLLQVADFNQLVVDATISEYDAPDLALGQGVAMTSNGVPGMVYQGTVVKISNSALTQSALSGTETVVPIQISVDNGDGRIKPGFSLDLEILVLDKPDALTVSTSAVKTNRQDNTKYVFMIDGERNLKMTPVTLGAQTDMAVEILSGVAEGDEVIASPTEEMRDGMPLSAFITNMGVDGNGAQSGAGGLFGGMFGGNNRNQRPMQAVPAGGAGGPGVTTGRIGG